MKRLISLMCIVLFVAILLSGCNKDEPNNSSVIPSESVSDVEDSSDSDSFSDGENQTSSANPDDSVTDESSVPTQNDVSSDAPKPSNNAGNTTSSEQKPTQTNPPTETTAPTDSSKPSDPPITSTPTPTPFDPQPYVDYAISYGKSIGLIYEPAIGNGNWDSPLNLYADLTDEIMRSGIKNRCERMKREGAEYFWVEAIKQDGYDSYRLFIYYG